MSMIISFTIIAFISVIAGSVLFSDIAKYLKNKKKEEKCICDKYYDNNLIISVYCFKIHKLKTIMFNFAEYGNVSGCVAVCRTCGKGKLFYSSPNNGDYSKLNKLSELVNNYNKLEDKSLYHVGDYIRESGLEVDSIVSSAIEERKEYTT